MPWIPITEADARTVLSAPELDAYRTAALAEEQPDPLPAVIAQVTELVRGYVAACPRNSLDIGATIPSELLAPALDILAVRLAQRVGQEPGKHREMAAAAAAHLLENVAQCEFDIIPSETPQDSPLRNSPTIDTDAARYARMNQEGV